jgi:hypothetical protein
MAPISFLIEGPVGAYEDSRKIARYINEWIDSKEFKEWDSRKKK